MPNNPNWKEQKAIGDQTETVIKFLIESMPDWECISYGIENHISELKSRLKENRQNDSLMIRAMPDFIAVNKRTNQIIIIDVKYRSFVDRRVANRILYGFGYGKINNILKYWNTAHFIIVQPQEPYFSVIKISDIEWYKHLYGRKGVNGNLMEQWDFSGIQKNIKEIFPELTEEVIQKAINMIPNKK